MTGAAMASRSLRSTVRPRRADGHRRLDREGKARDHERHAVAGGRQALVDEAEQIAEAEAIGRFGMDALAHLVADEREIARALADELRQRLALPEDHLVGVTAQKAIGHPEGDAIDEDRVRSAVEPGERTREIVRLLDGLPVGRPLGAVAPETTRARGATWATAKRLLPLRAPPRTRCESDTAPVPPAKTGDGGKRPSRSP